MLDPRDLNDYTFSAYRHARTLVGIDACGRRSELIKNLGPFWIGNGIADDPPPRTR